MIIYKLLYLIPVSESLIIVSDWNGHVGKLASDYPNVVVMVTVLATLTEKESSNLLLQMSLLLVTHYLRKEILIW